MFQRGPRMPMRPINMNHYYGGRPFHPTQIPKHMGQKGGGGLLSKLFSKHGTAMNRFGGQALPRGGERGGFLANFLNPQSTSSMFTNIQKVMSVANQVGPMVQQYAPMVRNIPTLLKLYKEISSDDDSDSEIEAIDEEIEVPKVSEEDHAPKTKEKRSSKPRIYI